MIIRKRKGEAHILNTWDVKEFPTYEIELTINNQDLGLSIGDLLDEPCKILLNPYLDEITIKFTLFAEGDVP